MQGECWESESPLELESSEQCKGQERILQVQQQQKEGEGKKMDSGLNDMGDLTAKGMEDRVLYQCFLCFSLYWELLIMEC